MSIDSRSFRRSLRCHIASIAIALACRGADAAVFTYQGVLKSAGGPLNAPVDLRVRLYDVPAGGVALGVIPLNAVSVADGLFTIELDFGPNAFNGDARWLEIEVANPANGGAGPFTTLTPRQQIGFAPMAQHALNATLSGTYANAVSFSNAGNAITGTFSGNGSALTSLNASSVASGNLASSRLPLSGPWLLNGALSIDNETLTVNPLTNRVDVGSVSQSASLHVAGASVFGGGVTFSNAVPQIPVTTRRLAIGPSGFRPTGNYEFTSALVHVCPSIGTQYGCVAAINVPDGATITGMSLTYVDNAPTGDISVNVDAINLVTGVATVLGSASTGLPSANVRTLNIPLSHSVSNAQAALQIRCQWTVQFPADSIRLYGAQVTYTVDEPLP